VGDRVYGGELWRGLQDPVKKKAVKSFERLALHARTITIAHPATGRQLTFTAPIPDDFTVLQRVLGL
jgi:23S rRNA pseudouridine1911/1915/1917 synthase